MACIISPTENIDTFEIEMFLMQIRLDGMPIQWDMADKGGVRVYSNIEHPLMYTMLRAKAAQGIPECVISDQIVEEH